jgi:cytochrome P450
MITKPKPIPAGPLEKFDSSQDLLIWLSDQCKKFGTLFKASIYGSDVLVVSDPRYAHYVLRENWQNYKKGQAIKRVGLLLGNGLMVSEGEFWKRQRRMIQPAFHSDGIGALVNIITTANIKLLRKWEDAAQKQGTVNVTRDISVMILEVVLISIFGDDYEQVAQPFSILSSETARDLQFAQSFRALGKIVVQIAAQRRKESRTCADLLGMLMESRDRESGERMPDRQLVSEIMTLIVAGHETTAGTLNWTWYLLSEHVDVEERLSRELGSLPSVEVLEFRDFQKLAYTRQVIEETMRLYPAGWLMTRKSLREDNLDDYIVPAGTEIYISPYLIQRHPDFWMAPERFDPDRFGPEQDQSRHALAMLPFSAGPRKCIGESFARIEMQIHMAMIAKSLRLRCVGGTIVEFEAGVNLRNKHDFIMVPEIKAPAVQYRGSSR